MLALHASIGSLNDFVDTSLDAGRKSGKPIPNGHATRPEALAIAVAGLVRQPVVVLVMFAGAGAADMISGVYRSSICLPYGL